ncbi:MAG: GDSL-type esterase/lipase family protein [Candidatus Saccharimonadales bacterium]
MILLIALVLILLALLWAVVYAYPKLNRTYELAHSETHQAGRFELGDTKNPKFKLLVLGDSAGSGHGMKQFDNAVGSKIANELAKNHHVIYLNEAGFGKWITDIKNDQIEGRWDLIALIVGSNDVLHGFASTKFRHHCYELVDKMKRHSPKIVIAGPGDMSTLTIFPWWLRPILKRREKVVAKIFQDAAKRVGAVYANTTEEPRILQNVGKDRLHLSAEGNQILYEFIWNKVAKNGWFRSSS